MSTIHNFKAFITKKDFFERKDLTIKDLVKALADFHKESDEQVKTTYGLGNYGDDEPVYLRTTDTNRNSGIVVSLGKEYGTDLLLDVDSGEKKHIFRC